MSSKKEQQIYLARLDDEIDRLLQRSNALVARIDDMRSIDVAVHSQVELLAAMRVVIKSLTVARAEAIRVLETGESRAHTRAENGLNTESDT